MTTERDWENLIQNWLSKANQSLMAGHTLYESGHLAEAVSRLYYAAFYAMTAVLVRDRKQFSKHTAVRAAVNKEYVKPGKMPVELGRAYSILFESRQESDYSPMVELDKSTVENRLFQATGIIKWAQEHVKRQ